LGESEALTRQRIDVRGLNQLLSVATEFSVTEIVGQDIDNVRLPGSVLYGLL
jgi:hypothetical protein